MKRLSVLLLLGGLLVAPLAGADVRIGIHAGYPGYYHPHRSYYQGSYYQGGYYGGYANYGGGWYQPWPYAGYGTVYSEPVIIHESPPVVVAPAAPAQPQPAVWYLCKSVNAYYPYVESCPEGWATVPAVPPDTKGKKP